MVISKKVFTDAASAADVIHRITEISGNIVFKDTTITPARVAMTCLLASDDNVTTLQELNQKLDSLDHVFRPARERRQAEMVLESA